MQPTLKTLRRRGPTVTRGDERAVSSRYLQGRHLKNKSKTIACHSPSSAPFALPFSSFFTIIHLGFERFFSSSDPVKLRFGPFHVRSFFIQINIKSSIDAICAITTLFSRRRQGWENN